MILASREAMRQHFFVRCSVPGELQVRLKNINLRMMLKKVEGNLRTKEQLAEG